MRLATGNETQGGILRSASDTQSAANADYSDHENQNRALSESVRSQTPDHREIVARATNDAVRDWSVKTGALSWPQGLHGLLGYEPIAGHCEIGFWQKNIHPEDRARISSSIRDALAAKDDKWTVEYRFRRADGDYIHLLERALILRDANAIAIRFVGSLMDITPRKQLQDQLIR